MPDWIINDNISALQKIDEALALQVNKKLDFNR